MEEFLEGLIDAIGDFLMDLFGGGMWIKLANGVWDIVITMINDCLGLTPESFSPTAWTYIIEMVYPFMLSVGVLVLNLMFMAGLIRQCTNLKENLTVEIVLDGLIKIMLSNFLMLNGLELMKSVFRIASFMARGFLKTEFVAFEPIMQDPTFNMFMASMGFIYCIVCLVCAAQVFIAVYGRYMHLYVLVGIAPMAWATIPGGHGISSSASAWLRTFLAKSFECVIISIFIGVAGAMCALINFGAFLHLFPLGMIQCVQNMAVMVILAAAVKGGEMFLRKAFGL